MKISPSYNLDKIKFANDGPTFEKAVGLFEQGKVKQFREEMSRYAATVIGTKPYEVWVDNRHFDIGDCECYLGQNDTLCKHMVAVAIYAVMDGKKMSDEDKKAISEPKCSGRLGELSEGELIGVKKSISDAVRCIKAYEGPSRIWFAYQGSLCEGCARLSKIVSDLPVSKQTAKLLVKTLLRLDKKLQSGGVDDSDGTVGNLITESVAVLLEFAKLDSTCVNIFNDLEGLETCFGWEEPLVELIDS